MAAVSGTNTGVYKGALVRVYNRDTGAYVGSALSDPSTGTWSVATPDTSKHIAYCLAVPGDPYEKYRVFGTDFDGGNGATLAKDVTGRALTWESVTLSNAQAKSGTTSAGAFGSGNRVKTPFTSDLQFPSGSIMTLEAWVFPTSTPASRAFVFGEDNETAYTGLSFGFNGAGTCVNIPNSGEWNGSGASLNINAWNHVGFTLSAAGTMRQFLNGTMTSSNSFAGNNLWTGSTNLCIGSGRYGGAAAPFPGYIDSVGIYKGVEKWTASFTAPTTPVPSVLAAAGDKPLIFDDLTPV